LASLSLQRCGNQASPNGRGDNSCNSFSVSGSSNELSILGAVMD
jgi:hypothetical protein